MKELTIYPSVFETAWGWCSAWISQDGIVAFQLPVKDMDRAKELLRKDKLPPSVRHKKDMVPESVPAAAIGEDAVQLPDERAGELAASLIRQVREYFDGRLIRFDLPLDWTSRTEFQRMIWQAVREVPCGETICYGELSVRAGRPGAARAVGHAMATNPIPLIVPCHRVVGANGSMCGFSADGGIPVKQRLLEFELETSRRFR